MGKIVLEIRREVLMITDKYSISGKGDIPPSSEITKQSR